MASVLAVGVVRPAPAFAADVDITVTIDGRRLSEATETKPIRLAPKRDSVLAVDVVNRGGETIKVKTVRLEGRVVGLSFFAYDTNVGLTVPPGGTGSRRFSLDLGGLAGQATGLVPGAVKLLDADRNEVASEEGVVDVRGSLKSVYGLFGLGIAILTALSFSACMIGLARHRLHPNRWRRAMRFLTPGLGLGLLINFTLSATRVFVPGLGRWLTIVVVSSAVFFVLGYLTPAPDLRTLEDLEAEEEERAALRAGAPGLPPGGGRALEATPAGTLAPAAAGAVEPVAARAIEPPPPRDDVARPVPMTVVPPDPAGARRPAATVVPPPAVEAGGTRVAATVVPNEAASGARPAPGTVIASDAPVPPARLDTVRVPAPAPVATSAGTDAALGASGNETTIGEVVPPGRDKAGRPSAPEGPPDGATDDATDDATDGGRPGDAAEPRP